MVLQNPTLNFGNSTKSKVLPPLRYSKIISFETENVSQQELWNEVYQAIKTAPPYS